MKRRITEKRLNNKRFKKSEEALIRAFFSERRRLNARVIMKRAKISRSTLYRHHRTIYDIVPDYEDFILVKYNRLMRKLTDKKRTNMRIIYYQMLITISLEKWKNIK